MKQAELKRKIKDELGWAAYIPFLGTDIRMSDQEYLPCWAKDVREALKAFEVGPLPPKPDENDCDDFTFRMLGHLKTTLRGSLGLAWSSPHSFVVFHDLEWLWMAEPFDKTVMRYKEALTDPFKRYRIGMGNLLII